MARILVLDGLETNNGTYQGIRDNLKAVFTNQGDTIQLVPLEEKKLAHCIGCFDCWLKTPGLCFIKDDWQAIARDIIQADTLVILTPVLFGCPGSLAKRMIDRFLPFIQPYFGNYHGETHHVPRYARFPRLVGIGVQPRSDPESAELFALTIGRNALNYHTPSQAAGMIVASQPDTWSVESLSRIIRSTAALPIARKLETLLPLPPVAITLDFSRKPRRALCLIGSPKVKSASTSSMLAAPFLKSLQQANWETDSLTLDAKLWQAAGQTVLLDKVRQADLVIVAFPLYIDTLPALVIKAFETMVADRQSQTSPKPQALLTIVNNGFPEVAHNRTALRICALFAEQSQMQAAGYLVLGAGEALSSGQSLETSQSRGMPPLFTQTSALAEASRTLAEGQPISHDLSAGLAKNPMPGILAGFWKSIFKLGARASWNAQAKANGVERRLMVQRPLLQIRQQ